MNTQDALAFWLTEEKPDKTRRRRSCLGCGETQEYSMKEPAPSYVAWFKAHQACRPNKSFDAEMPQEPGIPSEPGISPDDLAPLPECPQCGFVGVYLHRDSGMCLECSSLHWDGYEAAAEAEAVQVEAKGNREMAAAQRAYEESQQENSPSAEDDPRIQTFMTRTGSSYEDVQRMIDKGQITLRGPQGELAKETDTAAAGDEIRTEAHTCEALLDRTTTNPGHRSHALPPIPVSEALMIKIAQGYSAQSIADKSAVRKPFTYEGALYAHTGNDFRTKDGLLAYKLVPRDQWPGDTLQYKHLNPETGYHGIEVKYGKTPYVMQGPEVTFVSENFICKEKE